MPTASECERKKIEQGDTKIEAKLLFIIFELEPLLCFCWYSSTPTGRVSMVDAMPILVACGLLMVG